MSEDDIESGASRGAQEEDSSSARRLLGWIVWLAGAVALAIFIRVFVAEAYFVPTGSMLETIQLDDRLWGEKLSYRFRSPEQGEVIMFDSPSNDGNILVKRVIAVGGQTVDLVQGRVAVDGEVLDEPYTGGKESLPLREQLPGIDPITYPYTVPEGCLWVMGDNRTNSRDSRYFGAIPVSSVTAHAVCTFWPPQDFRLF